MSLRFFSVSNDESQHFYLVEFTVFLTEKLGHPIIEHRPIEQKFQAFVRGTYGRKFGNQRSR